MSEEKQDFLRRWSRRKQEASAVQKTTTAVDNPPALPALDSLTFDSDFKAFMHSKVEDAVKRAALKKLFADPHFNVMDGLDTYIDDYTKAEPFPDGLLARIEEVREKLLAPTPALEPAEGAEEEQREAAEQPKAPEEARQNVDPAQDPKAL
jgi:hypothetical protein